MISEYRGFKTEHRWEDLALIRDVVTELRPQRVVELGTGMGGFTLMLTDVLQRHRRGTYDRLVGTSWDVMTFDKLFCPNLNAIERLTRGGVVFVQDDVLTNENPLVVRGLRLPGTLLYCANGRPMQELEMYVPALRATPAYVGCHDYGLDVPPARAAALMAAHGFTPYRHADFEALVNEWYPVSNTRFWRRG